MPTSDDLADPLPMPDDAGLTLTDLDALSATLAGSAGWCVLTHHDPCGATMAVVAASDDAPDRPSFVVHREGAMLRLDVCRGDTYTRVGAYPALPLLLGALQVAVAMEG